MLFWCEKLVCSGLVKFLYVMCYVVVIDTRWSKVQLTAEKPEKLRLRY